MSELFNIPTLFTQLQSRYPTSSLLAELVQIHEGNFVVRALVQIGGVTLATGLATGTTVEQAEDQARLRVLKLLGITPIASPPMPSMPSYEPATLPSPLQSPALVSPALPTSIAPDRAAPEEMPTSPLPSTQTSFNSEFSFDHLSERSSRTSSLTSVIPEDEGDPTPAPAMPFSFGTSGTHDRNGDGIDRAALLEEPIAAPIDLTPLFLQIEQQMERIGWTREQGRKHLMRTYRKKSRPELTDEEIKDFLAYLKGHPSVSDAAFRE